MSGRQRAAAQLIEDTTIVLFEVKANFRFVARLSATTEQKLKDATDNKVRQILTDKLLALQYIQSKFNDHADALRRNRSVYLTTYCSIRE
jgi:hypothetical protein